MVTRVGICAERLVREHATLFISLLIGLIVMAVAAVVTSLGLVAIVVASAVAAVAIVRSLSRWMRTRPSVA